MRSNLLSRAFSLLPLALLALLSAGAAQAQDAYFSQPFAARLHTNPALAGLLDDYSATLLYRDQFPNLPGSYSTQQLALDVRLPTPGQHHALGLLLSQDRSGALGYTRLEVSAIYAYHTRLTPALALSGGLGLTYGRQRVGYDNLLFGDQLGADGSLSGPSAEPLDFAPVNYLSVNPGIVFYTEQAWLSIAAHHLNKPTLGFRNQSLLPARLSLGGGYKLFVRRPTTGKGAAAVSEISLTPTLAHTRQGGASRTELGLSATVAPVTMGAAYRNIRVGGGVERLPVATFTVGVGVGAIRLGYCYDAGLSVRSADLGGAHELSLSLRSFDHLEGAFRRLRRRAYPAAPFPAY